ncbi:hypothetical protein BT63DRAFT_445330 [Microthyrium microscopicum]|uniref:HRQ family protein n=1 Tax=Microthyrium microscopicum TaxID=703497 RepID=A0A6A6UVQ8_9PEZI|nr:hypothetical protein BT63DRAFT_445330 [Microthyrium microscopicum]
MELVSGYKVMVSSGCVRQKASTTPKFPDYASLSGVRAPEPYHGFDIKTAKARPYRPLRWKWHQTMALSRLEPDWWVELESSYEERIKQRIELVQQHGSDVLAMQPGSEPACRELMELVLQFLCCRYPHYFSLEDEDTLFVNRILNMSTNLSSTSPLDVMLQHVPEDFALMIREPTTGYYHLRAGIICSSVGWNLGTKIGLRLEDIHKPVPDYKEKMAFSMDRYFSKLPTDSPIQRGSWSFELDQPLYLAPTEPHPSIDELSMEEARSRIHFRVDWQTLRRMPVSGAIAFNFKGLFTPLEQFRLEPYVPALALKILKEGKDDLLVYKGVRRIEKVVVPVLEEFAREQVEKGIVPANWEVQTLNESPFYPGWKEMWLQDPLDAEPS